MSDTPLYDALCSLSGRNPLRLHMPGHKGAGLPGGLFDEIFKFDFTELAQTGNLYLGGGPIEESERLTAAATGVSHAFYLTGGSTQGVYTMLAALCAGKKVIADRASHKSFYNAAAMLGITPVWIMPESGVCGLPQPVNACQVKETLEKEPDAAAVFITSPRYHGPLADISAIARTVHAHGKLLLIDEAHGAHLPYMGLSCAVASGADIAVCSYHKTLHSLGQAAVITASGKFKAADIREAASLFGTSSPSYPVMLSIELARSYMTKGGGQAALAAAAAVSDIRKKIDGLEGFETISGDPLRLTVICGQNAARLAEILDSEYNIISEAAGGGCMIFIFSPADTERSAGALYDALTKLAPGDKFRPPELSAPVAALAPRDAFFAPKDSVCFKDSVGEICGQTLALYPPGVPVVAAGEIITAAHIKYFIMHGYDADMSVKVIRRTK